MKSLQRMLDTTVTLLNEVSGWILTACMILVTVNVLLRGIFGRPVLGTYEWVGILTSLTIGLGLAYCAKVDGHIMIDFILDRFPPAAQRVVSWITGVGVVVFMGVVCSAIFAYAAKLAKSGEVTPTTGIPFYLFVFVTGFCFLLLTAVLVQTLVRSVARRPR